MHAAGPTAEDLEGLDWDTAGFIEASSYRRRIVEALQDGSATPSELEEQTGVTITHVSRALRRLRQRGVVELLVDEDRAKGRLHGLTDAGEVVAEVVLSGGGD